MLNIARSKPQQPLNKGFEIEFIEHDITDLDDVLGEGENDKFDILTICSALALLKNPTDALSHWVRFPKPGGKMVLDVPTEKSMIRLRILGELVLEFGVRVLGGRRWVIERESLERVVDGVGLAVQVVMMGIFEDVFARTEGERVFGVVGMGTGFEGLGGRRGRDLCSCGCGRGMKGW